MEGPEESLRLTDFTLRRRNPFVSQSTNKGHTIQANKGKGAVTDDLFLVLLNANCSAKKGQYSKTLSQLCRKLVTEIFSNLSDPTI